MFKPDFFVPHRTYKVDPVTNQCSVAIEGKTKRAKMTADPLLRAAYVGRVIHDAKSNTKRIAGGREADLPLYRMPEALKGTSIYPSSLIPLEWKVPEDCVLVELRPFLTPAQNENAVTRAAAFKDGPTRADTEQHVTPYAADDRMVVNHLITTVSPGDVIHPYDLVNNTHGIVNSFGALIEEHLEAIVRQHAHAQLRSVRICLNRAESVRI